MLMAMVMAGGAAVFGHEPAYPPAAYTMHSSGHVYILPHPVPAAHGVAAPAPTYAYGWFGVVPRCHKSWHYGYYNNYHQHAER
jgi:hypothetical protein